MSYHLVLRKKEKPLMFSLNDEQQKKVVEFIQKLTRGENTPEVVEQPKKPEPPKGKPPKKPEPKTPEPKPQASTSISRKDILSLYTIGEDKRRPNLPWYYRRLGRIKKIVGGGFGSYKTKTEAEDGAVEDYNRIKDQLPF